MTYARFRAFERVLHASLAALCAALLTLLACSGCAPSHGTSTASLEPPGRRLLTAHGTPVTFPRWLDQWPDLVRGALAEIDSTVATRVAGDPQWPAGVPQGWSVVVELPKFTAPHDGQVILVTGETGLAEHVIYVGWRLDQRDALYLPALAWECGIARRKFEPAGSLPSWLTGSALGGK